MNTKLLKISTLGAYIVMVVVNALAVWLPIAGRETGEISDSYPNLFAPAGYAFSIWGLIYTLLAIYVIYQLGQGKNELVARINRLFIVNALLNAAWIFAWHYDVIWLSVLLMAGLLYTLIRLANILRVGNLGQKEKSLARLPFSVYFGWITVATVANVTKASMGSATSRPSMRETTNCWRSASSNSRSPHGIPRSSVWVRASVTPYLART